MKKKIRLTVLSFSLLSMMPLTACSSPTQSEGTTEDRPDEEITRLMRAIADGDANEFASLCDYPIVRRYPLRSIEDPAAMAAYFPVIADDSLRRIMRETDSDEWARFGWRGWTIRDQEPIWFDEGVQSIPYESAAEKGFRAILINEEMATLLPEYRGWTPVAAMVEDEGERIFRIDMKGNACRLMGFDKPADAGGEPMLRLIGSMHTEGSAGLEVYTFGDNSGLTVEYIPDAEPPLSLSMKTRNGKEEQIEVRPCYWRDYVLPRNLEK